MMVSKALSLETGQVGQMVARLKEARVNWVIISSNNHQSSVHSLLIAQMANTTDLHTPSHHVKDYKDWSGSLQSWKISIKAIMLLKLAL
jgi:hypothetical protein